MSAENRESRTPSESSPVARADRSRKIGVAALGTLLYALLADVAIETFWSGSPVRWWVLGVVLVYLAATVAVWRGLPAFWNRVAWSGRATASAFVGLGLLALTVWIPGGLERGIRLISLPTPVLLALIAAMSIVLAATMLIASPRVPLPGKWIVAALSLYGVVAFFLGAVAQVPYASLLNGGGLWVRLPRGLQGPFIAGVIILPLAIVVQILDRLLRTPSAPPGPWRFRQIASLVLVVVMATAGLRVPRTSGSTAAWGSPAGQTAVPPCGGDCGHASAAAILAPFEKASTDFRRLATSSSDGTKLTGAQARERLDYLFDVMDAARKQNPRETFDPKAIVDKVGTDTRALFAWAQDSTALVPYRGVLRGPVGVLMDRVGNSLDRSLLLAELLRLAGHRSRLAHATLSDEQARALAATLRSAPPTAAAALPGDSGAALDRFVEDYARRFQVDPQAARDSTAALQRQSAQAVAAASERVAQQAKFIEKALGNLVPRDPRPDPGLLEALRDHWWVQTQQDESWVDLDLAGASGDFGRPVAPAAETTAVDGLSADLFHTVTIRVVVEQWTPDGVDRHTALEHTIRPLDVLGKSIMLKHVPMSWPGDLDLSKEKNPLERVKSLVQDESEWLPGLTVGNETITKSSFGDDGEVNTNPSRGGGAGSPVGGAVGGLFGALAGGESRRATGNGVLSAEWVEFDIATPGRPPRTVRRDVFDLIGPAARAAKDWPRAGAIGNRRLERGLALARETEILVLGWDLSPDYVVDVTAAGFSSQRTRLSRLMVTTDTKGLRELADEMARGPRRPNRLLGFALARQALGNAGGPVFLDEPNVFAQNDGVRSAGDGRFVSYRELDIVHNNVGVLPNRDRNPFLVRLRHGVADTNAEALMRADCCGGQPTRVLNSADTLAASIDQGAKWIVARRATDLSADTSGLSPDVSARLQHELAGGSLLLLNGSTAEQAQKLPFSCWRIDPGTGDTVGLGENGTGQELTEAIIQIAKVAHGILCLLEPAATAKEIPARGKEQQALDQLFVCVVMMSITGTAMYFEMFVLPLHGAWAVFAAAMTFYAEVIGENEWIKRTGG